MAEIEQIFGLNDRKSGDKVERQIEKEREREGREKQRGRSLEYEQMV
jgi:hypothetical protein